MVFCRMCRTEQPSLVESHVVPKSIMLDAMTPGLPSISASTDEAKYPNRVRTGYYSKIVCDSCEKSFEQDDEILIDVYRRLDTFQNDSNLTYLNGVDPLRLQRSILCVLYRAHLSDHETYKAVDLGTHAESLRQFVLTKNRLDAPPSLAVVLAHRTGRYSTAVFGAAPNELDGATCIALYIPRLTSFIKFDDRAFDTTIMRKAQLDANHLPVALRLNDLIPSERDVIIDIKRTQGERISKKLRSMNKGNKPK